VLWFIFIYFVNIKQKPNNEKKQSAPIKSYIKIIPLAILFGAILGSFFSFMSDYTKELSLKPHSTFFHVFALSLVLIRFAFVKQLNIWNRRYIVLTGYFTGVVALLTGFSAELMPSLLLIILAGMFYGTTHGLLYPSLNVLFVETTPRRSGKATLIFIICLSAGMGASSLINGLIADLVGYSYMYLIFAGFVTLSALIVAKKKQLFNIAKQSQAN
jgi:MFS family permease